MIDVTKYMVLDKGDCLPSGDILCFAYVDEAHDIFANQILHSACTWWQKLRWTLARAEGSLKRFLIYVSNVGIHSQHVTFFNGRTYRDQLLAI